MDTENIIKLSQAVCAALTDEDDGLKRDILAHTGNRWSLGVIHILGIAGQLRHAEIARRLKGVTQRMLTHTLRHLERDGLIERYDYQEKLPRVEYALTAQGQELLVNMFPLWTWILDHAETFRAARAKFDDAGKAI